MSEKRYAILIGINDYEVAPLDYAVNDAELIKDCFINYCNVNEENIFPIKSTYNEPIEDIPASFDKALERIKATFKQEKDSIFFFFSGHGGKAGNSTAIQFKKQTVQLQDIYNKLSKLKPKFIYIMIDACYSGVGIEDGIAKSASDYYLSQEVAVASGYCIFCASANDKPAKEDSLIKNGRFTHLFSEILRNKLNYHDNILNLSAVYHQLDQAFKKRPEFRQLPFSQNRGLSTYPLAILKEENELQYYSNHYIDDIDNYDWDNVVKEVKEYGQLPNDTINEFVRLAREILRNSKNWGKANHLQIEISKNTITLIDNSGYYFDIFNPPDNIRKQGGITTATVFKEHFAYSYELNVVEQDKFVYQVFKFLPQPEEPCMLSINTPGLVRQLLKGNIINIPTHCKHFAIELSQGRLDLSWSSVFLDTVIASSKKSNVPVLIRIPVNDRLKDNIVTALYHKQEENQGRVTIE